MGHWLGLDLPRLLHKPVSFLSFLRSGRLDVQHGLGLKVYDITQ